MSGSVIGSDGYGYEYVTAAVACADRDVVTDADVDIGANSTIDQLASWTPIGAGEGR